MRNSLIQLGSKRTLVKIDPATQKRTIVAEVPMDDPMHMSWVHDIPGTENYIIVPDTPVLFDVASLSVSTSVDRVPYSIMFSLFHHTCHTKQHTLPDPPGYGQIT